MTSVNKGQQKLKGDFSGNGMTQDKKRPDFSSSDSGNPSGNRPAGSSLPRPSNPAPDSGNPKANM